MLTLITEIKEKLRDFCIDAGEILYIGGQEALPPPLSKDEEEELIMHVCESEDVRTSLIEHNLLSL